VNDCENHISSRGGLVFDLDSVRVSEPVVEINLSPGAHRRRPNKRLAVISRAMSADRSSLRHSNLSEQRGEFVLALARRKVPFGVVTKNLSSTNRSLRVILRTENVQPDGAERAGIFAEQPGASQVQILTVVTAVGYPSGRCGDNTRSSSRCRRMKRCVS